MTTIPSSTTLKDRLDRIAALQQRGSSLQSESTSQSSTGVSKLTGSAFRDKIARFEEKGGTPVPKSTFGLWAPAQTTKRNNELYGNRIPSMKELSSQRQKDPPSRPEFLAPAARRLRSVSASNALFATQEKEDMDISNLQTTMVQSGDSDLISSLHIEARSPSSPSFLREPFSKPKSDALPPILDVVPPTPLKDGAPEETECAISINGSRIILDSEDQNITNPKDDGMLLSDLERIETFPVNLSAALVDISLLEEGKEFEISSLGNHSGQRDENASAREYVKQPTESDHPDSSEITPTLSSDQTPFNATPNPSDVSESTIAVESLTSPQDSSLTSDDLRDSDSPNPCSQDTPIQNASDMTEKYSQVDSSPSQSGIPLPTVPYLASGTNEVLNPQSPNLDAFPAPPTHLPSTRAPPPHARPSTFAPTQAWTTSGIRASGDRTSISSTQSATPSLSFSSASTSSSPTATSTTQTQQQSITQPTSLGATMTRSKSHSRPKSYVPTWYDSDSSDDGEAGWANVVVTRRYY